MKKVKWINLGLLLLGAVLFSNDAYAVSAGDIFDQLAARAGTLGSGLKQSGYIIAAFGLIVFSFMAVFNKISWKNLAYIMMSCFILTFMASVINYIASANADGSGAKVLEEPEFASSKKDTGQLKSTDPKSNPVKSGH